MMKETVLSVLDSLMEPDESSFYNDSIVHYSVLEQDEAGFTPDKIRFNKDSGSCLQLIAKTGDSVSTVGNPQS